MRAHPETSYNQSSGSHVDVTSREVRVGPIEGPLRGNTYTPPIVQHPGLPGYAPFHSTTPWNPGGHAEQGGAKVLPHIRGPQWDILQATRQVFYYNIQFIIYLPMCNALPIVLRYYM